MDSVTRWQDVLALNWWVNLHSKFGWATSIAISAVIAADLVRRLQAQGEAGAKTVALFSILFLAFMAAIWLASTR